jgi:hypothetical protein
MAFALSGRQENIPMFSQAVDSRIESMSRIIIANPKVIDTSSASGLKYTRRVSVDYRLIS